jgi:uncharacterized protein (TIGR03118 family)
MLTAANTPISAMEGQSFTGTVATFTDSAPPSNASPFTAQIDWGDGHTSAGHVQVDPAVSTRFDVIGTHTFADEGPVSVVVSISDADGDPSTSVRTTSIVADAPIQAQGVPVVIGSTGAVTNAVVATLSDANLLAPASDFTAKISWGDNTKSTGTVVKGPKGRAQMDVLGSHVYHGSGPFNVQVTILDGGQKAVTSQFYTAVNLASSNAALVPADHIDPNLKNPWGLVASGGSPWWNSDNANGLSTLYNATGTPLSTVVNVPDPSTTNGAPAGIVAGKTGEFLLPLPTGTTGNQPSSSFIFDTEGGTISGWSPASKGGRANAVIMVHNENQVYANGGVGAVYNGLAFATITSGNVSNDFLYAANFRSGNVDVFNTSWTQQTLAAGAFQDPAIPAGYAPFGIQTLPLPNGNLVVTYAKQNSAKLDEIDGPGNGYVDEFTPAGALVLKLTDPQAKLNAPWGVALAPANFGVYSNDLLIGNFGDSRISAFDPGSGAYLGQLSDAQGHPLVLDGGLFPRSLWALEFGKGNTSSGPTTSLYFNSGINGESDGLFGVITANTLSTVSTASVAQALTPIVSPGKGKGRP